MRTSRKKGGDTDAGPSAGDKARSATLKQRQGPDDIGVAERMAARVGRDIKEIAPLLGQRSTLRHPIKVGKAVVWTECECGER